MEAGTYRIRVSETMIKSVNRIVWMGGNKMNLEIPLLLQAKICEESEVMGFPIWRLQLETFTHSINRLLLRTWSAIQFSWQKNTGGRLSFPRKPKSNSRQVLTEPLP